MYNGNSGGGLGGSKANIPFTGGMDIFWNYTIIDMLLARILVANFNLSGNFYFSFLFQLYLQTLSYPKTKGKQKLPEIKKYITKKIDLFHCSSYSEWLYICIMHSAWYQGINSKFVFKITLSSSSQRLVMLPTSSAD